MRALIQRVTQAEVKISGEVIARIDQGLLIFLGIKAEDREKDAELLSYKIANLRIMADSQGKMNLSTKEVNAEALVVSQFTLYADTNYGRRPSFIQAAKPEQAQQLYEHFINQLEKEGISVKTGQFGEYMEIELVNDGPVTMMLESPSTGSSTLSSGPKGSG